MKHAQGETGAHIVFQEVAVLSVHILLLVLQLWEVVHIHDKISLQNPVKF